MRALKGSLMLVADHTGEVSKMNLLKKMFIAAFCLGMFTLASATPPESSGKVIRFDTEYYEWWYDAESDMTAYMGFDPVYFCTYFEFVGTPLTVMQVLINDFVRYTRRFNGEASAYVYAGEPNCGNIMGQIPLATGLVRYKFNDNDVAPWENPDRHNMNSFGYNANGQLYSPDGDMMHLLINWHGMWDGLDPESYREIFKMSLK